MERVAFLIENTGERIGCLLNPDSLVMRRVAGVRPRRSTGGQLTGAGLADDPLLYTGGGRTELDLDLLFDVNLAGSSITTDNVHDLTRPLWDLAENAQRSDANGRPQLVRFVWGKSWNVPCTVSAVAERVEQFTPEGAPQRSWLRMRLLRVGDPPTPTTPASSPLDDVEFDPDDFEDLEVPEEDVDFHELLGAGMGETAGEGESETEGTSERLDVLAFRYYGDPSLWRLIALFNGIDDPLHLVPGLLLRIPALSAQLKVL
jgi:hypothetical protein